MLVPQIQLPKDTFEPKYFLKLRNWRKIAEVGNDLVKQLYNNGATTVGNVEFSAADKEGVEQQAREKAMENAMKKAEKIARAAGKRLGRLVSIVDDSLAVPSSAF